MMQEVECRICNHSSAPAEIFSEISCFRCQSCGTVQMLELPSDETLANHYSTFSENYTAGMSASRFAREMPKRHAAKVSLVQQYMSSGRLLDIGCGEGWFLSQINKAGFDGIGCDFSIRSTYPDDVKVLPGVIDAPNGLPFPDATFDIVTCWAVIEHVRYPKTALQEVMRLLRPGGIFLCDTPLCDDISEKLVAARSHWFCPPEHIHVFSHRALALLVKEAGLEILHSTPSFERTTLRLILRRTRNFFIGGVLGGALRLISRRQWTTRRQSAVTEIGDIQLFVARSPGKPQLTN